MVAMLFSVENGAKMFSCRIFWCHAMTERDWRKERKFPVPSPAMEQIMYPFGGGLEFFSCIYKNTAHEGVLKAGKNPRGFVIQGPTSLIYLATKIRIFFSTALCFHIVLFKDIVLAALLSHGTVCNRMKRRTEGITSTDKKHNSLSLGITEGRNAAKTIIFGRSGV